MTSRLLAPAPAARRVHQGETREGEDGEGKPADASDQRWSSHDRRG